MSMGFRIVYTSDVTGASVGRDVHGFHVIIEGTPMFGPVNSRSLAEDLADRWGVAVAAGSTESEAQPA